MLPIYGREEKMFSGPLKKLNEWKMTPFQSRFPFWEVEMEAVHSIARSWRDVSS